MDGSYPSWSLQKPSGYIAWQSQPSAQESKQAARFACVYLLTPAGSADVFLHQVDEIVASLRVWQVVLHAVLRRFHQLVVVVGEHDHR